MTAIRYVKKQWTAPLYRASTGNKVRLDLLWGDRVKVVKQSGARWQVKARGLSGYMTPSHLGTESLLELYFIDVGQGDGVLIKMPDGRHILIDGGWPRKSQPTGKNASDFVDWKFNRDYGSKRISLDAMICSHNDQDHYGGLWDLLDPAQYASGDGVAREFGCDGVSVENFYHAGLSWWKDASGNRTLGKDVTTSHGAMWTQLLENRTSLYRGLSGSAGNPKLQGEWAQFLSKVKGVRNRKGNLTPVARLSHATGYLPGYSEQAKGAIKVIAPVEFEVDGKSAIRKFSGGTSKNTNGNSVLLRLDYKSARILLTGDLNTASQQSLLADYEGEHDEFACDVAKACHHGSGDVSIRFLEKMEPACTVISSGDSEGHDHPRPNIVAASGLTGYKTIVEDQLRTPLVYSTELARSVDLGKINEMDHLGSSDQVLNTYSGKALNRFETHYKITMAGDRNPKSRSSKLGTRRIAAKMTYGLVNVRTDGETIMCAALNEKDFKWNVESFKTRF
jgi:beta-lactamase superfamily II metal-dependent hydrolase